MENRDWWYAVLKDKNDRDFSVGSFDIDEAEELSKRPEYDPETVKIAIVCVMDDGELFGIRKILPPMWVCRQYVE